MMWRINLNAVVFQTCLLIAGFCFFGHIGLGVAALLVGLMQLL